MQLKMMDTRCYHLEIVVAVVIQILHLDRQQVVVIFLAIDAPLLRLGSCGVSVSEILVTPGSCAMGGK